MFLFTHLFCFSSIYYYLFKKYYGSIHCLRSIFLLTAIIWGVLVTISTELFSPFQMIRFPSIIGFWLVIAFGALILANRQNLSYQKPTLISLKTLSIFEYCVLISMFFFLGIIVVIALSSPPNNWDSLAYHMSRIVHWIQNHSVENYPTHILRQLYLPPWAEYAIMHVLFFAPNDQWANIVQWFSLLGCLIGVSLIAQELGANRRTQIFSSVLVITIPMVILQGASTQNDLVVAFWLY